MFKKKKKQKIKDFHLEKGVGAIGKCLIKGLQRLASPNLK